MSLTVTVLGSSGMFATLERACAGYLVQIDEQNIWLDAGAGTWRNLLAHVTYDQLSGVILTHGHPDHTTDVFQAYHARQYGQTEPLPPIPLWAPHETIDSLATFSKGLGDAFDLKAVAAGDKIAIGEGSVEFVEMSHPAETLGIRITNNGAAFAFSSDTGDGADFDALAKGADVFICEATSQNSDDVWEGHLRSSQAAEIAARAGVRRLVLTHLRPGRDHELTLQEARAAAPGLEIELARDGATWTVGE